jgi:hypothetical protein
MKTRTFKIIDIDCESIVEFDTRKHLLRDLDYYIENVQDGYCDCSYESYEILYDDGTTDYINEEYDGHKIKKQHIVSIVQTNECTCIVFGNFEMNGYGIVYASFEEKIADENIVELK